MIQSGECEALQQIDGRYEMVGVRRKGNFIGISRIPFRSKLQQKYEEEQKNSHLQRSIRAVTEVQAIVLNRHDMEWAVEDDYRRQEEFQKAIRRRRREIRKQPKSPSSPPLYPPPEEAVEDEGPLSP